MLEGILVEGLIYGIMVLGVYITFRILDFPDLTVDGSFPLGAAIMATSIVHGWNFLLALLLAMIGGILAGIVTATIHNKLKVPNLLAGILTMTMLYSINIRILGSANLSLLKHKTVLTKISDLGNYIGLPQEISFLIFFILAMAGIKILLDLFFHTDLGLTLQAMGNNQQMVITQGVNPEYLKLIGVGLSNGLVALSGAFAAQYNGFADVGLGQGIIITGLASVMIGEFFWKTNNIVILTLLVILGSIAYKGIMYFGRFYGYLIHMTPNDLKLITGLLIIISLILTQTNNLKTIKNIKKSQDLKKW